MPKAATEAWGGSGEGEGWRWEGWREEGSGSGGEGRRRQTLDPIIPPQPLVKTTSRKLVKKPVGGPGAAASSTHRKARFGFYLNL